MPSPKPFFLLTSLYQSVGDFSTSQWHLPLFRCKCDGWQEQHLQTRRLAPCQCLSHLPSVFHLSSTDLTAFLHIVSFLTIKEPQMFSPLRTELYRKKIKLKDVDSRYLTCSTPNLPPHKKPTTNKLTPKKNPNQTNPNFPTITKLSWFLLMFFIS